MRHSISTSLGYVLVQVLIDSLDFCSRIKHSLSAFIRTDVDTKRRSSLTRILITWWHRIRLLSGLICNEQNDLCSNPMGRRATREAPQPNPNNSTDLVSAGSKKFNHNFDLPIINLPTLSMVVRIDHEPLDPWERSLQELNTTVRGPHGGCQLLWNCHVRCP